MMDTRLTDADISLDQITALNAEAWALRYTDIRRAIELVNGASARFDRDSITDPVILQAVAGLQLNLGRFHSQVGEYVIAIEMLQIALDLYKKLAGQRDVILTHAEIGRVHLQLSNYVQALEHTLIGFEQSGTEIDQELEAVLLYNLGALYIQREDYSRALPYLLKSAQLAQDTSNRDLHGEVLERISCAYTCLDDPRAGLEAGNKSLDIFLVTGNQLGKAAVLNSLGQACQLLEDFTSATHYYSQAEAAASQIELRYEVIRSQVLSASLHSQQGEFERSVEILESALKTARKIESIGYIVQIHQMLSDDYRRMQNYQKALFHYECFHLGKEQIINAENESRIGNMEVIYQVEAARREAELEQQKNVILEQEINERIQVEQALKSANERLQTEIREREALIADLDAFSRMVAHDLKTPLQNLSLLSYMLQRELANIENMESALDLVEQIQQTGLKAGMIINELLTLASLRSNDIEFTLLEMKTVIEEGVNRMKLLIDERKAEVILSPLYPQVRGHAPWIVEVVANLISNAIKYGGEPPKIEVGADPEQDGFTRFWIKDNGDGIPPKDQARLFHDFARLGRQQTGGHGLGLSITRRIISKLGGSVGVESTGKEGEGAVFWFTLPGANRAETGLRSDQDEGKR